MIAFKRTDHVLINIPTNKTQEARNFYSNVLELKEILGNHPNGAIWFNLADIELHIREEEGTYLSSRHIAFEIENLKEAQEFLTSKNIEISFSSVIEGRERCFFRDPFGNRFELIEYK